MKRILILAVCAFLVFLCAGSVTIYSQQRDRNLNRESKFQFKPVPEAGDQFKLINVRDEFGSRNKYRDFVNLVKQIEMKKREYDRATVRAFYSTHGFFKNNPKRSFYERANINMALIEYERTSKDLAQLFRTMQALFGSSVPVAKVRTAALFKNRQNVQQIEILDDYVTPGRSFGTKAEAAFGARKSNQEMDIYEIRLSRVQHFCNDVLRWVENDEKRECAEAASEMCQKALASGGDAVIALYNSFSGLDASNIGGANSCLGGCATYWRDGKYFQGHDTIREWPPPPVSFLPNYIWGPPCSPLGNELCKSTYHVEQLVNGNVLVLSGERIADTGVAGIFQGLQSTIFRLKPDLRWLRKVKLALDLARAQSRKTINASSLKTAGKGAVILAAEAGGDYVIYSAPIIADRVTFELPEGTYTGFIVTDDHYAVYFENLPMKYRQDVKANTAPCLDCGKVDFISYSSNSDYVYNCSGHCPKCQACQQYQWVGRFEGSVTAQQPCDTIGVFSIDGDFTVDFLLDDIKESDLPGGPVQDPEAYHFMNIPTAKAKVRWKNFTHRTCPDSCVIRFAKTAPSFEFWTAWDWRVKNDKFVGIELRFQQLKENTPVYCGPDKMSDFNIYSAGIMALPMKDPDKYVPRNDDVIERTWTDDKGPVKMKLKMRLEKKKKVP